VSASTRNEPRRFWSVSCSVQMSMRKAFLYAALVAGACSTPSVPIPPPDLDVKALSLTHDASNNIIMKGAASTENADALVFITNPATGSGVISRTAHDGTFTSEAIPANVNDTIEVQLELLQDAGAETIVSHPLCMTVTLDAPLIAQDCTQ
jgi:hypothetical protein